MRQAYSTRLRNEGCNDLQLLSGQDGRRNVEQRARVFTFPWRLRRLSRKGIPRHWPGHYSKSESTRRVLYFSMSITERLEYIRKRAKKTIPLSATAANVLEQLKEMALADEQFERVRQLDDLIKAKAEGKVE